MHFFISMRSCTKTGMCYWIPMREKRKAPVQIAKILTGQARRLKISEGMITYKIWDRWHEIAGDVISLHARPARWQKNALIVRVENSSWLQELSFLKANIVEKIRALCPEIKLAEIRFELGELPTPPPSAKKQTPISLKKLKKEEVDFIERAAGEIDDEVIQEAAKRAMIRGFERGR